MRRSLGSLFLSGLMLALLGVGPVAAFARQGVTMTVTTIFDGSPAAFVATGIPSCETGLVTNANVNIQFTNAGGIISVDKVFDCGSDNGFVVHLSARFDDSGSIGTWAVVAAWGEVAGMSGSGKLTGVPIENGITDYYVGSVRF